MEDPLKCSTEDFTHARSVYCPRCTRNYSITGHRHICNEHVPCNRGGEQTYTETYLADEQPSANIAMCDQCDEVVHRAATPSRDIRCPKCKFIGRYVHSGDFICPACKVETPPAVIIPTALPVIKETAEVARRIYVQARANWCDSMGTHHIDGWNIRGQYVDNLNNASACISQYVMFDDRRSVWPDRIAEWTKLGQLIWLETSGLDWMMLAAWSAQRGVAL